MLEFADGFEQADRDRGLWFALGYPALDWNREDRRRVVEVAARRLDGQHLDGRVRHAQLAELAVLIALVLWPALVMVPAGWWR